MKLHTMIKSSSIQQELRFHYLERNTNHERQLVASKIDLQVMVKTSFAERKPYVWETPMGSQIRQRKKSNIISNIEIRKNKEYRRGGR
jgi:hypothetical protein